MLTIGWAPVLAPWPDRTLEVVERLVPEAQVRAAARCRRWQDRQARLLARLILRDILRRHRVAATLDDVETDGQGRPFIREGGDFSISHTDRLAVCAWTGRGRLGIDVETARPGLAVEDMMPWMSAIERDVIARSADPALAALASWTAKEAVCKAQGCGVSVPDMPDCATPRVAFRGTTWHVRGRRRPGFAVSIATSEPSTLPPRVFRFRF